MDLMKGDVVSGSWVAVSLCEPKINDKEGEGLVAETHQNILQFDVAMDMVMGVDLLKVRNLKHLKYLSQTHQQKHTSWLAIYATVETQNFLCCWSSWCNERPRRSMTKVS